MHCHHHHDQVFELLDTNEHHCHCEHDEHPVCGHVHKITGTNIQFKVGDFIYWDSVLGVYALAVEGKCDLMVTRVNRNKTWFEAANNGDFEIKNYVLKGELYINSTGALTNTKTNTKVGFIDGGHLYLLIEQSIAIPSAQVNADWDSTSGVSEILNKPTIPAAQVNADWDSTSGVSEILNKPSIPQIPAASSTANRIALLGYDEAGALKVWYFDISANAPTGTPDGNTFATAVVGN